MKKAPTPTGVRLSRDEFGVPHIEADDLEGAYWGMGYCHALDRPIQMCLTRLLGQGRVSECLDASAESLEIDTFFRRMNWSGNTENEISKLTTQAQSLYAAYCRGVNARFEIARPWEFRLLRYKPDPWTIADTLLLMRTTGYVSLAQSQGEIEHLFVEMVKGGVTDDQLESLFPGRLSPFDRPTIETIELGGARQVPDTVKWGISDRRFISSNNWAVSPSRSVSGNALMANDPHLEINRLPCIWVEQVIELPDDTVVTANMPGLPGIVVGRNDNVSIGATYAFVDAVDSWIEDCRDGCFRREDGWVEFRERTETIKVKGGDPVDVVFYENDHGVLDGDPNKAGKYLTTRWAPAEGGASSLNATIGLWSARSVAEVMETVRDFEIAFSWVMADTDGHIGFQMSGLVPVRNAGATGFTPMPGWDPSYDWQGWMPSAQLPNSYDPPEGYIVTANNDLNHLGESNPINMSMGDFRARQIASMIEAGPCDEDRFNSIFASVHSMQAEEMMKILSPLLGDSPTHRELAAWNHGYSTDSRGAVVFEAFYEQLIMELFATEEVGAEVVQHLIESSGTFVDFYAVFDDVLRAETSPWLGSRTRDGVWAAALHKTSPPDGVWGDHNRVTLTNMLIGGRLPGFLGFDVGPVALPGGRATPHQGQVYSSAGRPTSFAPSLRVVADMGEPGLKSVLVGGPSDRRFSRWYKSDIKRWTQGQLKHLRRQADPAVSAN